MIYKVFAYEVVIFQRGRRDHRSPRQRSLDSAYRFDSADQAEHPGHVTTDAIEEFGEISGMVGSEVTLPGDTAQLGR